MATESGQAKASVNEQPVSPWAAALNQLRECGTRRHIKNAFKAGATKDEIREVLQLDVVQEVWACNLGVTILAEELERDAAA